MKEKTLKELSVTAFLDGRPGHEKQTFGIIKSLQKKADVHVTRVRVEGMSFFQTSFRSFLLHFPFSKSVMFPEAKESDLLIGTGSKTHVPLLLCKKQLNIPAVVCMNPAGHLRYQFDLCFVPEHDGKKEAGNIFLTVGAPNCSFNKREHDKNQGLLLLGGVDTKSHHWNSADVVRMIEKIVHTDPEKEWTISSSPRTPPETVKLISQLADKHSSVTFFDYKDTPAGWIEEQYDKSSVVWVTSDSISMIYEALSAGCRVGILPMLWKKKNSKFQKNEELLLARGLVKSFISLEQGNHSWGEISQLNEAQRCADRILEKWWPQNLP